MDVLIPYLSAKLSKILNNCTRRPTLEKIALITDSCGDLTLETMKKLNIFMFPIRLVYKNKEFLDKIEITAEEMYRRLPEEIPTTSLPDLGYCEQVLFDLKSQGFTHFIVTTVSTHLSGTYNAIRLMFENHTEVTHYLFDTKTLGYPQGVITSEIALLIQSGKSFKEVIATLEKIRTKTHGFIALDTLEYLKKGGRIGTVAATVGELLNLKPIISSNETGTLYTYAKARGKKKAITKIKEIALSYLDKGPCKIWILHADARSEGEILLEDLKCHPNILSISLEIIGPSMGTHTGPGVVGFALFEAQ